MATGPVSSVSADEELTIIMLKTSTMRGKRLESETVIAGKNSLMVNAQKLSPQEIIVLSPFIRKISQFPSKKAELSACETGRFEHILKKGGLLKKETGCLESERYKELKQCFKALAKDPLIDQKKK